MTAKQELEKLGKKIVSEIQKGKNPAIDMPVRALSNVVFDKKTCTIRMGNAKSMRYFFNVAHAKKFMQTIEVAAISKNLLDEEKHASLRDVFYMAKRTIPNTKVNIVDEQSESDKAIEDLELISDCARESLNINANKMGSVAGNVIVEDQGDKIDWSKLGSGGWSIPSNVENIKFLKSEAKYIIYMEKAAVWERLHEDKYWKKQKCIIMSSQGQTTRGIRRLLQRMQEELGLPIYVLTDFDPWGLYIYSVLKYGSISLAHITEKLAVPGCKFLGITGDDIIKYDLKKHFIKFEENDEKRLAQISKYDWFKDNKAFQRQFKMMKDFKAKAEIQAMSARGISFISEKYLPEKIKNHEWIE
ncbi:MAG: DNA topoisomerase IV subunit A [Nanoarchaeota archaeon]